MSEYVGQDAPESATNGEHQSDSTRLSPEQISLLRAAVSISNRADIIEKLTLDHIVAIGDVLTSAVELAYEGVSGSLTARDLPDKMRTSNTHGAVLRRERADKLVEKILDGTLETEYVSEKDKAVRVDRPLRLLRLRISDVMNRKPEKKHEFRYRLMTAIAQHERQGSERPQTATLLKVLEALNQRLILNPAQFYSVAEHFGAIRISTEMPKGNNRLSIEERKKRSLITTQSRDTALNIIRQRFDLKDELANRGELDGPGLSKETHFLFELAIGDAQSHHSPVRGDQIRSVLEEMQPSPGTLPTDEEIQLHIARGIVWSFSSPKAKTQQ